MNYLKLHDNLIELAKKHTPRQRLEFRNPNDIRLNDDTIYTEKHHIVPRHANGSNDEENLISLLPEEHYIIHLLRYKIYNNKNDFLAVRFIVNGFISKSSIDHRSFLSKLGCHKHFIQKFRLEHGWQTKEGRNSISKARKNTMPVVDVVTGEMIGSVNTNHPNVVAGKWVHHTKGKNTYIDEHGNKVFITKSEALKRRLYSASKIEGTNKGPRNSGFRKMTDEHKTRIWELIPRSIDENHFRATLFIQEAKKEFSEFKKLSHVWFLNNFGSWSNLIDEYNKLHQTSYQYNKTFRSKNNRAKISQTLKLKGIK